MKRGFSLVALLGLGLWALCAGKDPSSAEPIVRPTATVATDPVPHSGDAADDPAVWLHPSDPGKSLILGTDKKGALHAYTLSGKQVQAISPEAWPNNVDVLYGFKLSNGREVDLAVASTRGPGCVGVKVWTIDSEGKLADATTSTTTRHSGDVIPVFGGHSPYGIGGYRSTRRGTHYFFVATNKGEVEQYELLAAADAKVTAKKVRALSFGSVIEGIAADDEWGVVYFANEPVGIWKTGAEPDCADKPQLVTTTGEHGLKADVEGLTIYCAANGKGYLIASSQGNNTFKVYRREGKNEFVCTINPKAGALDDVEDTDGIAVLNGALGAAFPKGVFVVQDGRVPGKNQNFKLFRWDEIAGDRLLIDTTWDPRKAVRREGGD